MADDQNIQPFSDCNMIGWLEINDVTTQRVDGTKETPVVRGHIHTDKAYYGGRHPVVFTRDTAKIVIEQAKLHRCQKEFKPLVLVRGYLRSSEAQSRVVVRYVRFLDHPKPPKTGAEIAKKILKLVSQPADNGNQHTELVSLLRNHGIGNR